MLLQGINGMWGVLLSAAGSTIRQEQEVELSLGRDPIFKPVQETKLKQKQMREFKLKSETL